MTDQQKLEFLKAALSAVVAILTLSLGWFFGQRLTHYWSIRQKKRELELAIVSDIYKLYGEFFSVWKLWNYYLTDIKQNNFPKETRWELLKRATTAEAGMEAVFVRLSSERNLNEEEIRCLSKFRQAYQRLREVIKENKKLDWYHSNHPEYVAFKIGATKLAWMINVGGQKYTYLEKRMFFHEPYNIPNFEDASNALRRITSNEWENNWTDV